MTTHSTPTPPRLDLRLPAGIIEIELEARDTTSVELSVISGGEAGEVAIQETREELRTGGAQPEVLVHAPEQRGKLRNFGRQPELRMRIVAPLGSSIRASTISADFRCSDGAAEVSCKAISGDISVGDVTGDAKLDSTSGDLTTRRVGGRLQGNSVSGDISTGRIGADSRARSMSGDVSMDGAEGSVKASSMSGDISIGSLAAGDADLSSMSGDIQAAVVPGVRVFLDLRTLSGDAHSQLDPADDPSAGASQLTLKADTKSGDITVRRAAAAQPLSA